MVLPWDYNMSFGGFGGGSVSGNIYEPVSGLSVDELPLIGNLLAVPEYRERYEEILQDYLDYFANFEDQVRLLSDLIRDSVAEDPSSLYTMEQFEQALSLETGEIGLADGGFPGGTATNVRPQDFDPNQGPNIGPGGEGGLDAAVPGGSGSFDGRFLDGGAGQGPAVPEGFDGSFPGGPGGGGQAPAAPEGFDGNFPGGPAGAGQGPAAPEGFDGNFRGGPAGAGRGPGAGGMMGNSASLVSVLRAQTQAISEALGR